MRRVLLAIGSAAAFIALVVASNVLTEPVRPGVGRRRRGHVHGRSGPPGSLVRGLGESAGGDVVTLLDCPRPDCGAPLEQVLAKDDTDDEGEVMHVYCPRCRWELVDPELGDAEVTP